MLSFLKREKSKKLENQLNTLQKEGPAAWADLPEDELFTPAGFHVSRPRPRPAPTTATGAAPSVLSSRTRQP